MAGTDEVWGGGIGTATWAKIRFLASDGDDASTGLTPDSPRKTMADFWNANDIAGQDYSMAFLVKGAYQNPGSMVFVGGGIRSSSGCGSNKMLKGYAGTD